MIFVTVGSTKFDELIKKIDDFVSKGEIKDKVIAQIGKGEYIPKKIKYFRYKKTLKKYYKLATIVISHEGAGTLFELVHLRKKTIAIINPNTVSNPDLINKFSKEGYIIKCENIDNLPKIIKEIERKKLKKYIAPKCFIHKKIIEFLEK